MADRQELARQVIAKIQADNAAANAIPAEVPASIAAAAPVEVAAPAPIVPTDVLAAPPPQQLVDLGPAPMQIPEPAASQVAAAMQRDEMADVANAPLPAEIQALKDGRLFGTSSSAATPAPTAKALPAFTPEQIAAAAEPTQEQVAMQLDAMTAPARLERAKDMALEGIDKMRIDAERRNLEREDEVKSKFAELDAQVRTKSLGDIMQNGTFGEKLRVGLAVMLGALGQGMTKSTTNPVMDYFDKLAEGQATKDKLNLEQKNMLKQQLYQQGQLELQKLENATNNAYRKDQIKLQREELEQKRQEFEMKLTADLRKRIGDSSKWSGRALTPEQDAGLSLDERRLLVDLPDGRRVLTQSFTDANEYKKIAQETYAALDTVKDLKSLGDTGSSLSFSDRNKAKVMIAKLVGALRLPFQGPGVMQIPEKEDLIATIGNPLAVLSVRSLENAKLDQIRDSLMSSLQSTAQVRGIKEKVVPETFYMVEGKPMKETNLLNLYQQKYPGIPASKLLDAIRKSTPQL